MDYAEYMRYYQQVLLKTCGEGEVGCGFVHYVGNGLMVLLVFSKVNRVQSKSVDAFGQMGALGGQIRRRHCLLWVSWFTG